MAARIETSHSHHFMFYCYKRRELAKIKEKEESHEEWMDSGRSL